MLFLSDNHKNYSCWHQLSN
ncbi:hypothetical protein FKX85_04785 [Echinicola soli]|uniref:Uncharacterized protein n=1 Tax=Echinicola soli TaxID=2591634 RepID=A0A514CNV6_9BACT|nr:hypothetical protein FKX85_04785 [Echinicola soli]